MSADSNLEPTGPDHDLVWRSGVVAGLVVIGAGAVVAALTQPPETGSPPGLDIHGAGTAAMGFGTWLVAMGQAYRVTRLPALAYAMAIGWCAGALAVPVAVLVDLGPAEAVGTLGRHPQGWLVLAFWLFVAAAPLEGAWHYHRAIARARGPHG